MATIEKLDELSAKRIREDRLGHYYICTDNQVYKIASGLVGVLGTVSAYEVFIHDRVPRKLYYWPSPTRPVKVGEALLLKRHGASRSPMKINVQHIIRSDHEVSPNQIRKELGMGQRHGRTPR